MYYAPSCNYLPHFLKEGYLPVVLIAGVLDETEE